GRNLKNGRPAQPAMREKHILVKAGRPVRDVRLERDTAQLLECLALLSAKSERNKSGTCLTDPNSELLRDLISKVGGADLGNGQASGGNHQSFAVQFVLPGRDLETPVLPDARHLAVEPNPNAGARALF